MAKAEERGAELVRFIASGLVSKPDEVNVVLADDGALELEANADDRGRVIGRQGRVAKAMRALLGRTPGCSDLQLEIVD
ncbi:MAG: KH domain-containing protein [Myxococcota bacterium]|nr:KH domain-containing protein [Myxococcota bacterium]